MTTVLEVADELYALPLGDFTAARDAVVKQHKGSDLAPAVKALRKPSLAAWAVNLLVRREAGQVEQVLETGAALREAQEGMSADDLRELTRQRRRLTAAVTAQTRSLAGEEGVRLTASVAEQVEATLTAAMVDARCGEAVRSGLLVAALAATGVGEVDVAAAVALPDALGFTATTREAQTPAPPVLRVVPDPDADAKALAAAREQLSQAQEEAQETRTADEQARSAVEELEARVLQSRAEIDELRRRLADHESEHEEIEDDLGDAQDAEETARAERAEAETALEAAQAEVDRLS